MSNEIFPSTLSGYTWDSKKKPIFNTITQQTVTGRDVRISLYSQPVYEFTLANNWLTKADKDTLMGFFVARKGSFDSFLYADEDSVITAQPFATGNGVATVFQLAKITNGAVETVNNAAANPLIYINGVLKTLTTHYTITASGLLTFVTAPASGAIISWTGVAYYSCVFLNDALQQNQFAHLLYDCSEIQFKGSLAQTFKGSISVLTLLGDGTIDMFDAKSRKSGNISKDLIVQSILARIANGCSTSVIDPCLAANGITVVGGVAGKTYPANPALGTGVVIQFAYDPASVTYYDTTVEAMNALWIAEMVRRNTYPNVGSWAELTLTSTGGGVGISAGARWVAFDNGFRTVGFFNSSPSVQLGEYPEGGWHSLSNTAIHAAILPCLQSASSQELYTLLSNCQTGELHSFISAALS